MNVFAHAAQRISKPVRTSRKPDFKLEYRANKLRVISSYQDTKKAEKELMGSKYRVLIIDDDKPYADTLKNGLERYGFDVDVEYEYANARSRLVKQGDQPYDVFLIDVRLIDNADKGDTSGIDLAREIDSNAPKIILSKHDTVDYVRKALMSDLEGKRPAFTYVSKSEGIPVIVANIKQAVRTTDAEAKVIELDERLKTNHAEVSEQSAESFRDSRRLAYLGIGIIIICIVLVVVGYLDWEIAAIGALSGVLTQAIGWLFFRQQMDSQLRMDRYHQELAGLHKFELLLAATNDLDSRAKRNSVRESLLKQAAQHWFASLSSPSTEIATVIEVEDER